MASNQISGMPTLASLGDSGVFAPVVDGGVNKKFDIAAEFAAVGADDTKRLVHGISSLPAAVIYDDFDRPDGPLNGTTTPTGGTWLLNGPGAATTGIVNGRMVTAETTTSNTYADQVYGAQITDLWGEFSYKSLSNPAPTNYGPQLALIAQTSSRDITTCLHPEFSITGMTLKIRVAGGSFDVIPGGSLFYDIVADDVTTYPARMEIDKANSRVRVSGPHGLTTGWLTDARIGSMDLTVGTWQIQSTVAGSAYQPAWERIGIGRRIAGDMSRVAGSAPAGEIAVARGTARTAKKVLKFSTSAIGWYRVFTEQNISIPVIFGEMAFTSVKRSDGLYGSGVLSCSAQIGGVPAASLFGLSLFGSPVDQIRVSTSASLCAIDVHVNIASTTDHTLEFTGYGVPANFGVPQSGATSLGQQTLVDVVATPPDMVSGTLATAGRYAIGLPSTVASGGITYGEIEAWVYDTTGIVAQYARISVNGVVGFMVYKPIVHSFVGNGAISQFHISRGSGTVRVDMTTAYDNLKVKIVTHGFVLPPSSFTTVTALTDQAIDLTPTANQITGDMNFTGATTTSAPSAGGAGALPATPLGYLTVKVSGTDRKIAYY